MATGLDKLICLSLNHLIRHESWATGCLRPFAGAQVQINAAPFVLALAIDSHGLFTASTNKLNPDVTLTLPQDAAGRFLVNKNSLMSSVKISGSVDLAENLGFVLRNLRWDIEADLAQKFGDIPAHRLNLLGTSLLTQIQSGLLRAAQNITEFITEDSATVTPSRNLNQFAKEVDQLRDDTARLEQRLRQL